jgi:hypothetical protein
VSLTAIARCLVVEQVKRESAAEDSCEDFVTDLLIDLRHYCDRHALDFGRIDRCAYQHYLQERQ